MISRLSELSSSEASLLHWLSLEDESTLGECYGADLEKLVSLGYAEKLHPTLGLRGKVRLTEEGIACLKGRRE